MIAYDSLGVNQKVKTINTIAHGAGQVIAFISSLLLSNVLLCSGEEVYYPYNYNNNDACIVKKNYHLYTNIYID